MSLDPHARAFTAAVPDAKLIVLSGVGHVPQNAEPGRVVEAIEQLLARA